MYLPKTLTTLSTALLLTLPLALAQKWTATDAQVTLGNNGIGAAPGWFVFLLTNPKDAVGTNNGSISVWTETSPTADTMDITMCGDSSVPWQVFTNTDLPYPIGLHNSAKWCGGSNSDGLWLSYYDQLQMDVSTSGVCEQFYQTSKLSWLCWLEANPGNKKYGC